MALNWWQDEDKVRWYNQSLGFSREQMEAYVEPLDLCSDDYFIDFGCGDGSLLNFVAPRIKKAVGVDSTASQIHEAKMQFRDTDNVELIEAGFCDCDLKDDVFTKGSARKSLHHLKDDEKMQFFRHVGPQFAKKSLFIIEDVVFTFNKKQLAAQKDSVFREAENFYGEKWDKIKKAFAHTIFEEFPTDINQWRRALNAGGFDIIDKQHKTCFYGIILAIKN